MTTIHQPNRPYQTPDMLDTPGFFSAAMANDEDGDIFDQSFRNHHDLQDFPLISDPGALQHLDRSDDFPLASGQGTYSPLFPTSPHPKVLVSNHSPSRLKLNTSASISKHDRGLAPSQTWSPSDQEVGLQRRLQPYAPSPPASAKSPSQLQFGFSNPSSPQLRFASQKLGPSAFSTDVKSVYGQITPTSEEPHSPRDHFSHSRSASMDAGQQPVDSSKKRKPRKSSRAAAPPASSTRSQLKTSSSIRDDIVEEPLNPEGDVKRSKFLERNRVAASKCRQKKKEWTSNLEVRARELQQDKAQLGVMVSSLKEEMLFLKGELLRHSNCNCSKIRMYLDNEASYFAANPMQRYQMLDTISPIDPAFSGQSRSDHDSLCDFFNPDLDAPNGARSQADLKTESDSA